jgi:hypothetical protein
MARPTTDQINNLVKRVHPEYDALRAHWLFMQATYDGGRDWFKNHIFKYFKEGPDEYKQRVSRAYRFNHTREVVDLINKYLFRRTADRNTGDAPPGVKDFWKNVDGSGMNIAGFVRTVSAKASISGCPWVVVDSTVTHIDETTSESDVEEGRVYAYLLRPDQARDFSWGEDGKLNWFLAQETFRDDDDPFNSSGVTKTQYRLWTRSQWILLKPEEKQESQKYNEAQNAVHRGSNASVDDAINQGVNYEIEDYGDHDLGFVPVIRADNVPSDALWTVPALINDIAYLDRAVANYLSNLDAIIQDQTFSQLAIPAQNLMPGDEGEKKVLQAGTKRIFTYDGESGAAPFFLSPDPKQAELIMGAIQQLINEIYHSVGLAGERTKQDNASGIDNSSGVAKAKDFERVNSLLLSKAQSMQAFELELVRVVAAFNGQEGQLSEDNELVQYPESFDVIGLYDEIDIAMKLSLVDAPPVMRAQQMNSISDKLFRSSSKTFKKEVESEIDDWRERLETSTEMAAKQEENGALGAAKNRLTEEASRDRDGAGDKQSGTKTRQENRRNEADQATGQESN